VQVTAVAVCSQQENFLTQSVLVDLAPVEGTVQLSLMVAVVGE